MKARIIEDKSTMEEVISACDVCFVGMVDMQGMPYTLPFNFGYRDGIFYIHSGPVGKKIEVLRNNPNVCIVMSTCHEMYNQSENVACSYGMKYKSVMIRGKVDFLNDLEEKAKALNVIMGQYTSRNDFSYNTPALKNVQVMRIVPEKIDCKYFGY